MTANIGVPVPSVVLRLCLVLAVVCLCSEARAAIEGQNTNKALVAVRVDHAPVVDGRLDDPAWQRATPSDAFTQTFPHHGAAPSERTEVRVVYDDAAVYVGIRAWDSHPEGIVARLTRRDRDIESDFVAIGIDSRHSHSTAFVFGLNAAGVQYDYLAYDDTNMSSDWDAVWDGATSRDAEGWSAEMRIPLSVLRFSDATAQTWGFDAYRNLPRLKEEVFWSYVPEGVHGAVSRWGHLEGLTGLRPRRTFELRPYFATTAELRTRQGSPILGMGPHADPEGHGDVGVDFKVGLTSSLTLDGTINPDFGQVEADEVVLNLSRFETFFPEKRPFFLEGADVFRTPLQVFYSRRIGRPPSGLGLDAGVVEGGRYFLVNRAPASLPIWTAVKVTGTVGDRLTLGVLDAVTGSEEVGVVDDLGGQHDVTRAPPRNFAALRGRWSFGGGSSHVGFLATGVTRLGDGVDEPTADHDGYVQSVDARWATPGGRWTFTGQAVVSERVGGPDRVDGDGLPCDEVAPGCTPITRADGTPVEAGDVGFGALVRVDRASPRWSMGGGLRTLSPRLDVNDLGFVQQFNQHALNVDVTRRWTQPSGGAVNRFLGGAAGATVDYDGVLIEGWGNLHASTLRKSYWSWGANLNLTLPGQWKAYETGDGAYLERLVYVFGGAHMSTDSRAPVVFEVNLGGGHAVAEDGWILDGGAGVSVNAVSQMELSLGVGFFWEANDLRQWFYGGCEDDLGASCTSETDVRHYRFAELDSGFISTTLRGSWTFSPNLSLSAYAQLFMSQGAFHDRQVITTTGTRPFIHRDELVVDPAFTGDDDGDGKPDDAFQDTSLNVNVVMRWEMAPGSTLIAVYTRAQAASYDLAGAQPSFRLTGLSTGPTEEVLLVKFVYFYG
jgi:hypothetical protein